MRISRDKVTGVQELEVFRLAHNLVLEIYRQTKKFPKEETFGLSSQMQRAAVSIGSNLAEGANKGSQEAASEGMLIM
ncbi:MAG: four helix bundle protein [Deltaproteobacteria bacterium]